MPITSFTTFRRYAQGMPQVARDVTNDNARLRRVWLFYCVIAFRNGTLGTYMCRAYSSVSKVRAGPQVQMLKTATAIPFHKKLCSGCHNVPKSKEWQEAVETEDLHVFHIGKRTGSFIHWEPIFIGTNNDPLYDERLSWEGKSDKMTQVSLSGCLNCSVRIYICFQNGFDAFLNAFWNVADDPMGELASN